MFLILLTYKRPFEEVEAHLAAHREYLLRCYEAGVFLASGPKVPRDGGVILAHCPSLQALQRTVAEDPFCVHGIADYQLVEFAPTKTAAGLEILTAT